MFFCLGAKQILSVLSLCCTSQRYVLTLTMDINYFYCKLRVCSRFGYPQPPSSSVYYRFVNFVSPSGDVKSHLLADIFIQQHL